MRKSWFLAIGAALAPSGLAQTVDASPEVVVVTGVGPDRTSDELIASTTVLDEEGIALRLSGGLGDTLEGLPGVASTAFGPGASRPIIRGLGAERVQVLTNGLGVIDASAASPDHAVTGDPLGAERIEILRGPATLAYGGGASGGVVNVIDGLIVESAPSRNASAQAYAGYTTVDSGSMAAARAMGSTGSLVGVVSLSLREAGNLKIPGLAESARLRAAEEAAGEDHDDEEAPAGEVENSFVDTDALSAGLTLLSDTAFLGAAVRLSGSRYGIVGGHAHHEGEEEEEGRPFIDMEQVRLDVRGGMNLALGPVRRIVGALSAVDYEHSEFESPGVVGTRFTNNGYEARIEAEHGGMSGLEGSFGVQSVRRDFRAVGDEAFVSPTETRSLGAFLFETFDTGVWGLEGGIRLDRIDLENVSGADRSFDTVNASFGAHRHVGDDLFLGLAVSRTERAPTDVELFANGPHLATQQYEVGNPSLQAETGVTIEGSARWESGPLRLDGSVYQFAFSNFIYLNPTGDIEDGLPVFETVQADSVFTGAEIEAGLELGKAAGADWRGRFAVDVVRAKLSSGGNLPRIPPASATLGLKAEAGRLRAGADLRWVAEQARVTDYELPTDSYVTLGAHLTYDLTDQSQLIFEANNLTDEEVRPHSSPLKDLVPLGGRGFRLAILSRF